MGKKSGLFAAVLLLFVIAGALGYFAYKKLGRHPAAGLASVPRDSVVVFDVDAARVRAYPPARRLRSWLMSQHDFASEWQPIVAACGFDPIDRLDQWVFALDRLAIASGPQDGIVSVATGHASTTESMRCLSAAMRLTNSHDQLVPVGPVGNHPVLAIVDPGGTISDSTGRLSLQLDRVVMASSGEMQRALAVLDRRQPGADRNETLRGAVAGLGENLLAYGVADVQAVIAILPRDFNDVLAVLAAANPSGNAGTLVSGTLSLAVGLQQTPHDGLRVVTISTHRTPGDAQSAAAIIQQSIAFARAAMAMSATHEEGEYIRRVTERIVRDPTLAAQIPPLQQVFTLANGLLDRVHVRTDGVTVREELEITGAEVTTFENGLHAFAACEQSFERMYREDNAPPAPPPVP